MFEEVHNAAICPTGPDPLLMIIVGLAVGFFIGMNLMLVYVKLKGSPFRNFDVLADDINMDEVDGITEEDVR